MRAIVFKTIGDENIGESIRDGLIKISVYELEKHENDKLAKELRAVRTQLNILKRRDSLYWQQKIDEARKMYGTRERTHRFPTLLGAYWLFVYAVSYFADNYLTIKNTRRWTGRDA